MKPTTLPLICGITLVAISTAGFSHWWSIKTFVAAINSGLPIFPSAIKPAVKPADLPALPLQTLVAKTLPSPPPAPTIDPSQQKFYETLITKMENLQNQNRDLLDQMAETNRDVMKLEFRVDTHSESFRPMPVSEEQPKMSVDNGSGVLPPRAVPVFSPSGE